MDDDPHDLQRFVDAQAGVYARVCAELDAGAKTSHWMWFIFPQLRELGRSGMARRYGIASLAEAKAYLGHPLLGPRLRECTRKLLAVPGLGAHDILGSPDDLKLRSCLTLFGAAAPQEPLFGQALQRFHGGAADEATLRLLSGDPAP